MIKLLCLPPAGMTSGLFQSWHSLLLPEVELATYDYPGRGKRTTLSYCETVEDLLEDIKTKIDQLGQDYAILGHSMGAYLAQLLSVRQLRVSPIHVFLSGFPPPHLYQKSRIVSLENDDEFIDAIVSLGAIPKEVVDCKPVLKAFAMNMKKDFEMLSQFDGPIEKVMASCGITVLNGQYDPFTQGISANDWAGYSSHAIDMHVYDGDHFFVKPFTIEIVNMIKQQLS